MERLLIFEPGRLAEACLGATAGRPGRHFPAAAAGHPPLRQPFETFQMIRLIPTVESVPAVHTASPAGPFGRAVAVWPQAPNKPNPNTQKPP